MLTFARLGLCNLNRAGRVTQVTISTPMVSASRVGQVESCYGIVTSRATESSHSPLLLGGLPYVPMRYGESPTLHIHHPDNTHDYGRPEPRTSNADIDPN